MTAAAGSGDAWRISGEDRVKHDSQFFTLKPVNGFVTGVQARGFFMQSGLPTPILGQIWSLADMNNDGKMDKKEFSIAMHLIKKKLQGYELPKSLPHSLKADPAPMMGSFGTMPAQPAGMMGMAPGMGIPPVGMAPPVAMTMGQRMPMMVNGMPQMVPTTGFMGAPGVPVSAGYSGGIPARPGGVPGPAGAGSLAMPHGSKLKYTQMFNTHDRNKRGTLTGVEARSILVNTGVPQQMLAQIWNLSDVDKDGKLNCDEFCIAMHLIDVVKMGQPLPAKLPAELLPGKARSGSFGTPPPVAQPVPTQKDSFGDLVGSMGMPAPVQPTPVANGDTKQEEIDISPITFEDRRKENFDKGQAELERRRQMLQDQLRKEEEARMEKERKEHEKREKHRLEQERKKQQELERQLEKQKEIERQREEQRQKMMEQREAARRELERQRQMEWERQRKEQLMTEKGREYEQLMALKARSSNLKCELESLQGKKTEISTKISQVKNGVTDFTAHIEAMRSTRDLKNNDIDRLQGEIQEVNQKLASLQSDRQTLDLRVQTTVQANPMSETHRTMMHSVELKKTSVQRLKKDLEQIEKDTGTKLAEIDTQNTQLTEFNKTLSQLQNDINKAEKNNKDSARQQQEEQDRLKKEKDKHETLRKELEAQRLKEEAEKNKPVADTQKPSNSSGGNWFDFGGDTKAATASNDNWASVFDTKPADKGASDGWSAAFSSQTTNTTATTEKQNFKLSGSKQKFKAMYQFDARNPDELTLTPGDTVMVFDDQTGAEPGWKGGEKNGKCGWFPEAYVEKIEDSSQSVFQSADVTPGISTSEDSSFISVPGKMPAVSPTPGQGQAAPDGLQAQALYPWKAKKDNHLTFNKGDVIQVKEQQDMWWSGEIGGKTGWFPKSYVRLISGPTPTNVTAGFKSDSPIPTIVTAGTPVGSLSGSAGASPAMDKPAGEMCIGVYSYQSAEPGDLTFNVGEIIMVTKKDGDWWTGSIDDRSGIFPANYVKPHEVQPADASGLTSNPSKSSFDNTTTQNDPFPSDPFKILETESSQANNAVPSTGNNVSFALGDAFTEDPFKDLGNTAGQSPFTEDPFKDVGNSAGPSPFTEDPFAGLGLGDTSLTSPGNEINKSEEIKDDFVSVSDLTTLVSSNKSDALNADTASQSSVSKSTEPFAAFLDTDPTNEASAFPGPPSGWLESMERDADNSLSQNDLGSLVGAQVTTSGLGTSSQTTDSLLNLAAFGSSVSDISSPPVVTSPGITDPFPSLPIQPAAELTNSGLSPVPEKLSEDEGSNVNKLGQGPGLPGSVEVKDTKNNVSKPAPVAPTAHAASPGVSQTGTLKKPEIATVIAAYTATGEEQLSLSPGQLIQVRKKSPSGWWEGELQARGQKRKIGWFPANYVKLLGGSARSTPDNTLGAGGKTSPATTSLGHGMASSPAPQTSTTPQPTSQTYVDHVIAIYPYQSQHADELTFQKDAVINVIKKDDPDWWQGEYNGAIGMFPSNYVQSTTPESSS